MKFPVSYCLDFPQLHCKDVPIIGNVIGVKKLNFPNTLRFSFLGSLVSEYVLILNKRAMMALDCSPESFPPTNEFYIFVPLVPTSDPRGGASFDPKRHHMNKIDNGLQGITTYQKFKFYPFQFQGRRILKLVFFVPMFKLVTPGVGSVLTPTESN